MTQVSDFNTDLGFSNNSIPAWKETLKKLFGPKLYEVQIREERETQLHYWDAFLVFKDEDPIRIELKSRRMKYHPFYKQDGKRVLETMGNVELGKLGSSIFNSNIKIWGTGFFDGSKIIDPLVFHRKPVADNLAILMRLLPWKYKEITNKPTDGLYHSKFVLVEESLIIPHSIKNQENTQ